jgi:hypothetical protein
MNGNGHLNQLVRDIDATRAEIRQKRAVLSEAANPVHRFKHSWNRHRWPWITGAAAVAGIILALALRPRKKPYVPKGYVVVSPEPPPSTWLAILGKTALSVSQPVLAAWMKNRWNRR